MEAKTSLERYSSGTRGIGSGAAQARVVIRIVFRNPLWEISWRFQFPEQSRSIALVAGDLYTSAVEIMLRRTEKRCATWEGSEKVGDATRSEL